MRLKNNTQNVYKQIVNKRNLFIIYLTNFLQNKQDLTKSTLLNKLKN